MIWRPTEVAGLTFELSSSRTLVRYCQELRPTQWLDYEVRSMCQRGEAHFAATHEQFASALTDSFWTTSYALLAALVLASLPALNKCNPSAKIAVALSGTAILAALVSHAISSEETWAPSGLAFWVSLLLLALPLSLALVPAASTANTLEGLVAVVVTYVSLAGISSASELFGWGSEVPLLWIASAIYSVVCVLAVVHFCTGTYGPGASRDPLRSDPNG